MQSSLNDFPPSATNASDLIRYIVDGPGTESYPLSILSLVLLKVNYTTASCSGEFLYMSLMLWGYTNSALQTKLTEVGYAGLTFPWLVPVMNQLVSVTCNGNEIVKSSLMTGVGPTAQFFSSYSFFFSDSQTALISLYKNTGTNVSLLLSGTTHYVTTPTLTNEMLTDPRLAIMCAHSFFLFLTFNINTLLSRTVAAFPIVVGYNIPNSTSVPLVFDMDTLVKIYMGNITMWNDPAIQRHAPTCKEAPHSGEITQIDAAD